jgi:translation initiation factor 1 (eIF-1/SUI1)
MKTKLLLSTLLLFVSSLWVNATVLADKTMIHNGKTYKLNYCLPNNFNDTVAYPLIVAMHYCGGTAVEYRAALSGLSDSLNTIVVCPDNNSNVIPESELQMLVTTIDSSKVFYKIDTSKVYLTGMSCNGEFITRHGLKNFYPFKGIFPWVPWITGASPKLYDFNSKMPIVIAVGSDDTNYKTLIAVYDSLAAHNAKVNLVIVPSVGHSLFGTFSNEMINCIYYLNSTPDFSFDPIAKTELNNNDSIQIAIKVNNPNHKDLKYSLTVDKKTIVKKAELLMGDDPEQMKVKIVANPKYKGKLIFIVKAFDPSTNNATQVVSSIDIKLAPTTSIKQQDLNNLSIYPNPVSDKIYFSESSEPLSIEITNLKGEKIMEFQHILPAEGLQVQSLKKGYYLMNVCGTETKKTIKFLKQ